jgi:uncharacterized protein
MRVGWIAAKCLFVAALAAATMASAADPSLDPGRIEVPAGASESGVPPPEMRLRAIVARALDDSIATWKRLVAGKALEVGNVNVRFVAHLSPANCFGLYTGDGPAYCSGNATVFVGVDTANRLMSRFGAEDEAGITFLIGHEIGHHIQNIFGRFQLLHMVARSQPWGRAEFQRRFELEADCFAGVWIKASDAWAKSDRFRANMRASWAASVMTACRTKRVRLLLGPACMAAPSSACAGSSAASRAEICRHAIPSRSPTSEPALS